MTNPEMLHVSLLPGHGRWGRLYRGLRYIVIDEIHTYAGFFGANMANVLRRLARVCEHYGSRPQFICSSATVGNPLDVAQRVTGRRLRLVDRDASASGSRTYVFWNPPRIKKGAWRARRGRCCEPLAQGWISLSRSTLRSSGWTLARQTNGLRSTMWATCRS